MAGENRRVATQARQIALVIRILAMIPDRTSGGLYPRDADPAGPKPPDAFASGGNFGLRRKVPHMLGIAAGICVFCRA
jgi:hypothetical protein